jgi:hypothetical protein
LEIGEAAARAGEIIEIHLDWQAGSDKLYGLRPQPLFPFVALCLNSVSRFFSPQFFFP